MTCKVAISLTKDEGEAPSEEQLNAFCTYVTGSANIPEG